MTKYYEGTMPSPTHPTTSAVWGWRLSETFAKVEAEALAKDKVVKSVKKPTEPMPTSQLQVEKLKKEQAKKARKEQIRRNGGKR